MENFINTHSITFWFYSEFTYMFLLYGWLDQKAVQDDSTERKMLNIPAWNAMFCTNWINKIPGYWMVQLPYQFSNIPIIRISERSSRQPRNKIH